jgi:hypothetical protein
MGGSVLIGAEIRDQWNNPRPTERAAANRRAPASCLQSRFTPR